MARRGADSLCFLAGTFLILAAVFTFIFPRVSYTEREEGFRAIPAASTHRTITVPRTVSAVSLLAGFAFTLKSLKIRKRGSVDEVH